MVRLGSSARGGGGGGRWRRRVPRCASSAMTRRNSRKRTGRERRRARAGSWAPCAVSASAGATSAPSQAARSRSSRLLPRRSRPRPPRSSSAPRAARRASLRLSTRRRMRRRPCPRLRASASSRCTSHRALGRRRSSFFLLLRSYCKRRLHWGRSWDLGWVVEDEWCRRRRARARVALSHLPARLVRRWLLPRRRRSAVQVAVGRRMAMGHSTDMACLPRSTAPPPMKTTSIARVHAHQRSLPAPSTRAGRAERSRCSTDDVRPSLGSSLDLTSYPKRVRRRAQRSNTNHTPGQSSTSTSTSTSNVNSVTGSASASQQDITTAKLAYKELAALFYTINAKYRISRECAELLIELGGGPPDASSPAASATSPMLSLGALLLSPQVAMTASASAHAALGAGMLPGKKRSSQDRAITLAGRAAGRSVYTLLFRDATHSLDTRSRSAIPQGLKSRILGRSRRLLELE